MVVRGPPGSIGPRRADARGPISVGGGRGDGAAAGQAQGTTGFGTIERLANGRWRLTVSHDGRKVAYGRYATEDGAAVAQARWKLTGLLPADDLPAAVAVGGVRCDEWFGRWQGAKRARSSIVRAGRRRGGAESTAARDRSQWRGHRGAADPRA